MGSESTYKCVQFEEQICFHIESSAWFRHLNPSRRRPAYKLSKVYPPRQLIISSNFFALTINDGSFKNRTSEPWSAQEFAHNDDKKEHLCMETLTCMATSSSTQENSLQMSPQESNQDRRRKKASEMFNAKKIKN